MERISVMFWKELNRYIGTEEVVFTRRQVFECIGKSVNRTMRAFVICSLVISGSRAEGLSLPGSDFDLMYVLKNIPVSDDPDILGRGIVIYRNNSKPRFVRTILSGILIDTDNTKPGFARLVCSDTIKNHKILGNSMTETNDGLLLSSLLLRNQMVDEMKKIQPDSIPHGPCATCVSPFNKLEIDYLFCLSSNTWPKVATEWIYRVRNNNWPLPDLISDIANDGCLLVPVGNSNSLETQIQWRISFSLAEKKLVHSFNHTQLLCYGLLKLYLKHVINSNAEVKDLFCSYFLKTSLFYCIEEDNLVWIKENFLNCFWTCVRRLIKWVRDEYCPNYFIKANNMFEGKVFGSKSRVLLEYLSKLHNDGLDSMKNIPCLSDLRSTVVTKPLTTEERELIFDKHILKVLFIMQPDRIMNNQGRSHKELFFSNCKQMEQSTNGIHNIIFTMLSFSSACLLVQPLFFDICKNTSNKTRYKQNLSLKKFIRQNCMFGDVCTGKLLLATLCYMNGEYHGVDNIVQKVLTEFKPYTMYSLPDKTIYCLQTYINEICGKGLTMAQKLARGICAQAFVCVIDYKLYPQEIEPELVQYSKFNIVCIPPVMYSKVLLFLSYHHMARKEKMRNILHELHVAVKDEHFVHESERPLANALLHRCLQIWKTWQLH